VDLQIYAEDMRTIAELSAWYYRVMSSQYWKRQYMGDIPREVMKISGEPIKNEKGVK
jgi:hypothetical protein